MFRGSKERLPPSPFQASFPGRQSHGGEKEEGISNAHDSVWQGDQVKKTVDSNCRVPTSDAMLHTDNHEAWAPEGTPSLKPQGILAIQ